MDTNQSMDIDPQEQKPGGGEKDDSVRWAGPVERLKITGIAGGARTINIENRKVASPLQGFGPMWERHYRVRLSGADTTPAKVVAEWKKNFAVYQPPENHFYPSLAGVIPGEMVYIETKLPLAPGLPGVIPMKSGVLVLYGDDEMFTVMTPEGFPISGWNTFSAHDDNGTVVAQIDGLLRTTDPIYEFGFRFMGGEASEDRVWYHVLNRLAEQWGVKGEVQFHKVLVDPRLQWQNARNVWNNAAIRSFAYYLASPVRWLLKPFSKK